MSWLIELLPILLPILKECIVKDGEIRTKNNLRRSGPMVQFKIYRTLRKNNVSDAKQKAIDACNALASASENDIEELMSEAR
jgi:hypothetical protein